MPTVYITAPEEVADELAETLVEERLAACVNTAGIESVFRWEDEINRTDDEVLLLAKTTDSAYEALVERVTEMHPYEVPCIERFDEESMLTSFAQWRDDAVETS